MRNWITSAVACVGFSTALLGSAPVFAADAVPADKLLPPKVLAYLSIPDVDQLKTRWNDSVWGKLRQDEAFADFWKEVDAKIEEHAQQFAEKSGMTVEELLSVPSGRISFAFVQPAGEAAGMVVVLDYGDSEDVIAKLREKAEQRLEEQGAEAETVDVEGTEVTVYTISGAKNEGDDADADADSENSDEDDTDSSDEFGNDAAAPAERKVAFFQKDNCVVIGSDVPVMESVLARWDGEHEETFADNEVWSYISERTNTGNEEPIASWYIDPIEMIRIGVSAAGEANPMASMVLGFLPALGVNNLKAIGGSMDLNTDKFDSVSNTLMYVDFPTTGILNLFHFPAMEQSPPEWVPADASLYYGVNWDVDGAYTAVEGLWDMFQGPGAFAQMMNALAKGPQGPGVHPKKDIIDLLSGQIHVMSDMGDEDDPTSVRFAVGAGIKDAEKAQALLAKMADSPNFTGEAREFEGVTLYDITAPDANTGEDRTMSMGVVKEHLVFSSDPTLVEQIIRSGDDSLADADDFKQVAEQFPDETSIISFQRQEGQLKAGYEWLRSEEAAAQLPNIDFSTLPDFEELKKYLTPTGGYAVPDEHGAFFQSFSLPRESN